MKPPVCSLVEKRNMNSWIKVISIGFSLIRCIIATKEIIIADSPLFLNVDDIVENLGGS